MTTRSVLTGTIGVLLTVTGCASYPGAAPATGDQASHNANLMQNRRNALCVYLQQEIASASGSSQRQRDLQLVGRGLQDVEQSTGQRLNQIGRLIALTAQDGYPVRSTGQE